MTTTPSVHSTHITAIPISEVDVQLNIPPPEGVVIASVIPPDLHDIPPIAHDNKI